MKWTFFLVILLAACGQPTDQQVKSSVLSEESEVEAEEKLPVPILNYDELEYIFQSKSDTTYVINFWATWCKPCVAELPYFEEIHTAYPDEKIKVILVSLDFPKQYETKLIPFLEEHKLKSEVILLDDPKMNVWIDKVDPSWSGAIPATVFYKADKREFHEANFVSFDELDKIIKPYLN